MATRKEPVVVVFEEPTYSRKSGKEARKERDMFLRGDVSAVFDASPAPSKEPRTSGEPSAAELDLKATLREVHALGASAFTGKTKRRFEEEQIRALGAKPSKSEYVPYPHYQMVAKAQREKERRQDEEMGVSRKKRKRREKVEKTVRGRGRWKDRIKSLEPAVGKFRNGVLTLSGKELSKIGK